MIRDFRFAVEVGDWIRFYRNGTVVIGVVLYQHDEREHVPYGLRYLTDAGPVQPGDVLEVRRTPLGDTDE